MVSQWAYAGLMGLFAVERVGELWVSRRNARQAFAQGAVEVGRGHFRVMALVHAAFLVACPAEVFGLGRRFPGAVGWACLVGVLLAQGLRYWAILTLGVRWNVRIIVWPERAPVTAGPYRFLRHPNYLAVATELLLVPLVHGAWICATVFTIANALLLRVRIRAEEAALGARYAETFAAHRRLVPGLPRS